MEQELQWMVLGAALASKSWREDIIDKLSPEHFTGRARGLFESLSRGDLVHRLIGISQHSPIVPGMVRLLAESREGVMRKKLGWEMEQAAKLMPTEQFLSYGMKRFEELKQAVEARLKGATA